MTKNMRATVATLAIALALLAGVVLWQRRANTAQRATETNASPVATRVQRVRVPISAQDPAMGATNPLVTIVWFDDMSSPTCSPMRSTLDALLARYPNDVQVVWKDRPSTSQRPLGHTAAVFGRYVFEREGNAAFWRLQALAAERLRSSDAYGVTPVGALFDRAAETDQVTIDSERFEPAIERNLELGHALAISATPYLLVNGGPVQGLASLEQLSALVAGELERAKALSEIAHDRARVREELIGKARLVEARPYTDEDAESDEEAREARKDEGRRLLENEVQIAAKDDSPIELSAKDLKVLRRAKLDPENFKHLVRLERAKKTLAERAIAARTEAGLE